MRPIAVGSVPVPRVSNDGAAFGPRLEGAYRRLMPGRCRCGTQCRSDPRLWLAEKTAAEAVELRAAKAECQREAEEDRAVRAAAGEPVRHVRYHQLVGGQHGLPREQVPYGWHIGQTFTVHPDDTISVA